MSQEVRNKLLAVRAKLEISQAQAAAVLEVPLITLKQWEQDKRTPRGLALKALLEKLDRILAS